MPLSGQDIYPAYSVAIRTLGKAGEMYEDLIRSLKAQAHPPKTIFVYLAEGYAQPQQVADEVYFTCPKGMVSQRARRYEEVDTEYLLFCDDDVYLQPYAVETLFDALLEHKADGIAANTFPNHSWPLKQKFIAGVFYGTLPSFFSRYAFRIRLSSYYSYALCPQRVMPTQSFAGPCFLLRKSSFLDAHFEDETWMDCVPYANGDDQLLAYKLYLGKNTLLIHYDSGIVHRDAKTSHIDKTRERFYNNSYLRYIIWYRTIFQTRKGQLARWYSAWCFYTVWLWQFILSFVSWVLGRSTYKVKDSIAALRQAKRFVESEAYRRYAQW